MGEGSESCRLCVGGVGGKGWHMDRSWDPTGVSATADCRPPADPWQSFLPPNPGLLGCARPALRAVEEGAEGDGACRPDLLSGLVGASGVGPLSGAPRSIGASGGVGARPSALSGEVPAGHHSEETMQMNSTAWPFSPGTAQAHRGVPPSCAAHARGLKKERLTPHPRAFRGQRGSRRPRHGGRPFRERGRVSSWGRILPAQVGQRGWDRRRFLPSVKAVLPQGRGEWACLLVKGSYFHVKGLFVFSARAAP